MNGQGLTFSSAGAVSNSSTGVINLIGTETFTNVNNLDIDSGVVNYVGDWTMRVDPSRRMQLNPTVKFEKSTLERYVTQYPEISYRYEIYLSAMGQDAISLDELAKKTE